MNMIMHSVLTSHVANETQKAIRHSSNASSNCEEYVETESSREDDRMDMWVAFILSMFMGIGYWFIPESETGLFVDTCYLIFYMIFQLPILFVILNNDQPRKAVKTALWMSMAVTLVMLVPFILSMDTTIHFRECMGGFGIGDKMYYLYRDHTDYTNLIEIGFMVLICLVGVIVPLRKLKKMKKEL